MKQYIELGNRILNEGDLREDRTGVGTLSVNEHNMRFDLRERFPLVTVKETRWKTAFLEMLWFLRGEPHTKYLHQHGCKLWDAWADESGIVGPIYGVNWRSWPHLVGEYEPENEPIDQIAALIDGLKNEPQGRRHIVSAWNVADLNEMALPPCHWAHRCYVTNRGELDLTLYLRSSDFALGLPFNIAGYALLTHLYARAAGLTPRYLHVNIGDAHIYLHHVLAMRQVLTADPYDCRPWLLFNTENTDIDGYNVEDFSIENYVYGPFVKLEVAV